MEALRILQQSFYYYCELKNFISLAAKIIVERRTRPSFFRLILDNSFLLLFYNLMLLGRNMSPSAKLSTFDSYVNIRGDGMLVEKAAAEELSRP